MGWPSQATTTTTHVLLFFPWPGRTTFPKLVPRLISWCHRGRWVVRSVWPKICSNEVKTCILSIRIPFSFFLFLPHGVWIHCSIFPKWALVWTPWRGNPGSHGARRIGLIGGVWTGWVERCRLSILSFFSFHPATFFLGSS